MKFKTTHKSYSAGEEAPQYSIGDFVLCHRRGFASACIRFGQRIRFTGSDRPYAFWSHAALVVSPEGDLIEALTKGVSRNHIDEYKDIEYTLVRVYASVEDQQQIFRYANKIVGERYSWATILSCAFATLFGSWFKFYFGFNGHAICSGLIARAEERMGAFFDREPQIIMPADLAKYYNVSLASSEGNPVHRK